MRFIEYLIEAEEQIGVVVSDRGGNFYDIDFVDYNTLDSLTGHYKNLGDAFIRYLRENQAWQDVLHYFHHNYRGKPLGEDYSSEDADFVLYGPLSPQQLNTLQDKFEEKYGYLV